MTRAFVVLLVLTACGPQTLEDPPPFDEEPLPIEPDPSPPKAKLGDAILTPAPPFERRDVSLRKRF